jgi:hypothetical protein
MSEVLNSPESAPTADFGLFLQKFVSWHNALRPPLRIAFTLGLFVLMAAFYGLLIVEPENFYVAFLFGSAFSPIVLLPLVFSRLASKRQIHELAGAILPVRSDHGGHLHLSYELRPEAG